MSPNSLYSFIRLLLCSLLTASLQLAHAQDKSEDGVSNSGGGGYAVMNGQLVPLAEFLNHPTLLPEKPKFYAFSRNTVLKLKELIEKLDLPKNQRDIIFENTLPNINTFLPVQQISPTILKTITTDYSRALGLKNIASIKIDAFSDEERTYIKPSFEDQSDLKVALATQQAYFLFHEGLQRKAQRKINFLQRDVSADLSTIKNFYLTTVLNIDNLFKKITQTTQPSTVDTLQLLNLLRNLSYFSQSIADSKFDLEQKNSYLYLLFKSIAENNNQQISDEEIFTGSILTTSFLNTDEEASYVDANIDSFKMQNLLSNNNALLELLTSLQQQVAFEVSDQILSGTTIHNFCKARPELEKFNRSYLNIIDTSKDVSFINCYQKKVARISLQTKMSPVLILSQ